MISNSTIIFDFDGTIADTMDAAFKVYNRIAPFYLCKPGTMEQREHFRNQNPLEWLPLFGVTKFKLPFLVLHIRRALTREIETIELHHGMGDLLHQLKADGHILGILTSNSSKNISRFLKAHSLTGLFDFIYSGKSIFGKHRQLGKIVKRRGSSSKLLYVGDETRDIEAAKKTGISSIAVGWGFMNRGILETLKPEHFAAKPSDILTFV